jgi:hypothetical protein
MMALTCVAALGAVIVLFLPNEAQMNAHLKGGSGNHL